jgi:hypothetical protein
MPATISRERTAALDRLAEFFRDKKTRAGVLARRVLKIEAPGDADLVGHLLAERRRRTRLDGSLDGALVPTAWLAWELLQLEYPTDTDNAGVVRTVGFLLTQQDQPGRFFGEGCRPFLHERRWCEHHVGGFFSPGPAEHPVAPLAFPVGVVVSAEQYARFAASCFALRTVVRAGEDRRESVRRHVVSLLEIPALWEEWGGAWAPDLVFFALGAIASPPLDLRERAVEAAGRVIARQRKDGSWEGADLFHALDMVPLVPTEEARKAVRRAVPLLCTRLADGVTLEGEAGEERGLVALHALTLAN